MTEAIRFDRVCVDYGRTRALSEFSLSIAAGETVTLLGPSGSGKSTALKALAGFERPVSGRVHIAGRDVTNMPPYERGLGVVVQQYALFPHMRVADNVAFGLRARRTRRTDLSAKVTAALAMVGMDGYTRRYPAELSGGQQQRVAIARALAISPSVLLLDEPLSALDAKLRQDMVGELQGLRRELPDVAMLYVTHDQIEALSLADRIVIMRDGAIVDSGTTTGLYRTPPSPFTASFLGDANLLPARVTASDLITAGGLTVPCLTSGYQLGADALLCLRPHELRIATGWDVRLAAVQWRGASYRLSVETDDAQTMRLDVAAIPDLPEIGGRVSIAPVDGAGVLVPAESAIAG